MKIEKNNLKSWLINAYERSCHQHNTNNDIENIDISGIYEILERFEFHTKHTNKSFELYPVHIYSDGGIKEFLLICKIGKFRFLLAHWKMFSDDTTDIIPCGFDPFVNWLYEKLKPLPDLKITEELIFNN